jgi:3-methyladenine DNA glycosylase/8-oxoguanine DNA glycosylase
LKAFAIQAPRDFDFRATVWSHGWCFLSPFASREEGKVLERPFELPAGRITRLVLRQPEGPGSAIQVDVVAGKGSRGGLDVRDRQAIERAARRMLRLDEDFTEFHALCRHAGPPFDRAPVMGFGRLLRSPTLFEDLVKVLATTNVTWGGTRAMVGNLVAMTRRGIFPSPGEIAAIGAARLRSGGRWGYRAAYLAALAAAVEGKDLDLDAWESWPGTTDELEETIRRIPGFGPYAAGHVLALLGRYDRIAVDTDFRSFVRRRHFPRARKLPSARRMLQVYEKWGKWRFLAYWWEMWSESYAGGVLLAEAESQATIARSSSARRPAKK